MAKGNGIAIPQDFRARQPRRKVERVVLPVLGLPVLLSRPGPLWMMLRGQLPTSIAARGEGIGPAIETAEDLAALAQWLVPLLKEVFVQPRVSMTPGEGEISPDDLDMDDVNFVIRWAVGEVEADGSQDLGTFRDGVPGSAPVPSGAGGDVVDTAEIATRDR